jgi:hypothetical protein
MKILYAATDSACISPTLPLWMEDALHERRKATPMLCGVERARKKKPESAFASFHFFFPHSTQDNKDRENGIKLCAEKRRITLGRPLSFSRGSRSATPPSVFVRNGEINSTRHFTPLIFGCV